VSADFFTVPTLRFQVLLRYLLRDRDRIFGGEFSEQVQDLSIQEGLSAPRAPWQPACVERVIGTIRRECLDHVLVFNETSLYRYMKSFVTYYHESGTHLALGKDSPESRPVQPPELGGIVATRKSAVSIIDMNGVQPDNCSEPIPPQVTKLQWRDSTAIDSPGQTLRAGHSLRSRIPGHDRISASPPASI
jgi:hypothetical protein